MNKHECIFYSEQKSNFHFRNISKFGQSDEMTFKSRRRDIATSCFREREGEKAGAILKQRFHDARGRTI